MNLFKVSTLVALVGVTSSSFFFTSLEALHLRTLTENSNASASGQQQLTLNTSLGTNVSYPSGDLQFKCTLPCIGQGGKYGGSGGGDFDDFATQQLFGIESILINSGAEIDSIQVTYTGGLLGPNHGGSGGGGHRCNFIGDPIVAIELRSGTHIDNIKFIKKSGQECGPYGGSGGSWHRIDIPQGMILGSIYGSSGTRVDSLGFYYARDPALCNSIISTKGRWVNVNNFPVSTEFAVTVGTTHSDSVTRTSEWSSSVSLSVSAGFDFNGASSTTSVSSDLSHLTATVYESVFSTSTTTTVSYMFPAGSLWQWRFTIIDECGTSSTFKDYQITPNGGQEPCCPPGLFADPSSPIGLCLDDSVALKEDHCPLKGAL